MSSFGYDLLGFGSSANTEIAVEPDDEFNRVSFLSHFDGANNGVNNAFDDGSADNLTISTAGNVTQGSFSPFFKEAGNWSVDFSGISSPLIRFDSDSNMGAGTGAYTVEAWVNWSNWAGTNQRIWLQGVAGTDGIVLGKNAGENKLFTKGAAINYSFTPTLGRWYHIAVVRANTNTNGESLYIDGTRVAQGTQSGSVAANQFIVSGLNWAANYNLQGKVSNFRYTKAAVYSGSSFTPIEEPLSAITYTEILTCQDHKFIDNSARARPILQNNYDNGKAIISGLGPFLTDAAYDPAVNGASTYFSGAEGTAIIITDDLTDFQFGTGAFTVEGWVYRIGGGSAVYTIHQTPVGSGSYLSYGSSGKFNWGSYGNGDNADSTISTALANNQWIHFAAVRTNTNSNGLKIYINGVVDGTFTDTSDYDDTPFNPRIGGFDQGGSRTGNDIHAYISDIRVVKGTAVYTGDFTPPTAPLTAITNTKLLLNMAGGQAIDSAAQNNLTLLGGAKLSTGQAKFGTTSAYFDGSAYMDTNRVLLGPYPENFTVEFWYYGLSAGDVQQLVAQYNSGNATGVLGLNYMQSGTAGVELYLHGSTSLNMRAAAPQGQWVHVALTRSINDFVIYINGTSGATGTSANTIYGINTTIGGSAALTAHGYDFKGYMSDLRITKAVRYTDNFTAPAAPPPIQGQV